MLIRRHRPTGRFPEASGLQSHGYDAALDIRHVKDKFPKLNGSLWLAERLGRAITERRAFISYRQSHRQRLADQGESDDQTASTIATSYDVGQERDYDGREQSQPSLMTGATSFMTTFGSDEDGELRIPELTQMVFHGIKLDYNTRFECPFCRTIQMVSSKTEWK